jgi:hypothetical protein
MVTPTLDTVARKRLLEDHWVLGLPSMSVFPVPFGFVNRFGEPAPQGRALEWLPGERVRRIGNLLTSHCATRHNKVITAESNATVERTFVKRFMIIQRD